MAHTLIKELYTNMPASDISGVVVNGWVRTLRESKAFAFVELNDGTYFKNLQIILEAEKLPDYAQIVKGITTGAAIEVEGTLALTPEMKQPFELKAEKVAIVGDLAHSRVCGSLAPALKTMGADVTLVAPPTFQVGDPSWFGCNQTNHLDDVIEDMDVVYMLRVQMERLEGAPFPSLREYNMLFGLTQERDRLMRPDAIICHPGPINRGVELDSFMADHPERSVILNQVYAGLCVRMSVLYLLLGGNENDITA